MPTHLCRPTFADDVAGSGTFTIGHAGALSANRSVSGIGVVFASNGHPGLAEPALFSSNKFSLTANGQGATDIGFVATVKLVAGTTDHTLHGRSQNDAAPLWSGANHPSLATWHDVPFDGMRPSPLA